MRTSARAHYLKQTTGMLHNQMLPFDWFKVLYYSYDLIRLLLRQSLFMLWQYLDCKTRFVLFTCKENQTPWLEPVLLYLVVLFYFPWRSKETVYQELSSLMYKSNFQLNFINILFSETSQGTEFSIYHTIYFTALANFNICKYGKILKLMD